MAANIRHLHTSRNSHGNEQQNYYGQFYLYVNANNLVLCKKKSPKQHELHVTVIEILQKRILLLNK